MKNVVHQLPPQKNNDTFDKEEKSRENFNRKFNTSITSTKNNIDTVNKNIEITKKHRSSCYPQK